MIHFHKIDYIEWKVDIFVFKFFRVDIFVFKLGILNKYVFFDAKT